MKYLLSLICFITCLTATGFALEAMLEDVPPGDEMAIDVPTVAVKFTKESTVADVLEVDFTQAHSINVIENAACASKVIEKLLSIATEEGKEFPHLTELSFCGSHLHLDDVKNIADVLPHMPSLYTLCLTNTKLCDDGMHAIGGALNHPRLTVLFLCGNPLLDAKSIGAKALADALPCLPELVSLYLMNTPVGAEGRKAIKDACKGMPRLREVAYRHSDSVWISPSGREYFLARPPRP